MKLLDGLLGRTSPVRSREDQLVALAGAVVSLEADLGLVPAGQGGLVLRHLDSAAFQRAEVKLAAILELAGRETGAEIVQERDSYGYHWVVVTDAAIADLVSTVYSVALELRRRGLRRPGAGRGLRVPRRRRTADLLALQLQAGLLLPLRPDRRRGDPGQRPRDPGGRGDGARAPHRS